MPILAVYIIPHEHESFYQAGSDFLGYDIRSGIFRTPMLADIFDKTTIKSWLGKAPAFGFHATVGDALQYSDDVVPEVILRLEWIARRIPPFRIINGGFDKAGRYLPHSLTATFEAPDSTLDILHYQVVTAINVLYDASPFFERHSDSYHDDDRAYFIRYGVPHYRILDKFDVHFSFATSIPDQERWQQLRTILEQKTGLFTRIEHQTLMIDEVHLVEQQENGYFRVRHTLPLTGQP
jgi:hypothetical protein